MTIMDPCGVCDGRLFPAETLMGTNGRQFEIAQCGACGVLCNWTALTGGEAGGTDSVQEDGLENVYGWPEDATEQRTLLVEHSTFLDQALTGLGVPRTGTFLDVGCGRGLAAVAACAMFDQVVATDLRPDLVDAVCRDLGRPSNLTVLHGLLPETGQFDVIWMWHLLEHLPRPRNVMTSARALLGRHGLIVLQVPLYRPSYVFDQHLYFYNHHTLTGLTMRSGLKLVSVGFDLERSFMSAVLELQ